MTDGNQSPPEKLGKNTIPRKWEHWFQKVLETKEWLRECIACRKILPIEIFVKRGDNHQEYRGKCKPCHNERTRIIWRALRKEVFDHYWWQCKCCGETIKEFLSLDHIHNDWYKDKSPWGGKKSGKELYLLVKKEWFPDRFQTLCMNCNWWKKLWNGICPHKQYE